MRRTGTAGAHRFSLAVVMADGDVPPSEFRIFRAGLNENANGAPILFDETAAASVLAHQTKRGLESMIDLEHLSLDDTAPNYTPDARGWCRFEVRRDGAGGPELWAVDVKWTPDGARRLAERTQRYISPVFFYDSDNRPTRLLNVALCAMPALDNLEPLVAAKENIMAEGSDKMGAVAAALGISVDPATDPAGFVAALTEALSGMLSELSGSPDAPAPDAPAEVAPPEEMAAAKAIMRLVGAKDATDAIVTVGEWRRLAVEHKAAAQKLAEDAKAIESTKRRSMTARLVAAGAETPATAWADDAKTEPAEHLALMSLDTLEKRCASFEARGPAKSLTPAAGAPSALSARELAMCKQLGVEPVDYAAQKAAINKKVG